MLSNCKEMSVKQHPFFVVFSLMKSVAPKMLYAAVVLLFVLAVDANQQECLSEIVNRKFHRLKRCRRSDETAISKSNQMSLLDCMSVAKEKNGLAFNYSPTEGRDYVKEEENFYNCIVLGCPEGANLTTLVEDWAYDYYSAYGNLTDLINSTCIKSMGMFRLFEEKQNYTSAIDQCQRIGADLAHVLTETRTVTFSTLVATTIPDWFKAAYVGLDDSRVEGLFETPLGDPISCYKFRAWSPGHPRNVIKSDDCVVVDSEKSWKVVNCRSKLPFLCEYFTASPGKEAQVECNDIEDEDKKADCKDEKRRRETGQRERCDNFD